MMHLRFPTCAGLVLLFVGCNSQPPPNPREIAHAATDVSAELAAIQESLRKPSTDEGQIRQLLEQLNAILATAPDRQSKPLTSEQLSALQAAFALTDSEASELNKPAYSQLDAHYVYQCLTFRDVARALQLPDNAKARTDAAIQWVVAHVRAEERNAPVDPPVFVVNRGFGSGVERLNVFVALMAQLGLPVSLLGDPEAASDATHLWGSSTTTEKGTTIVDPRTGIPIGNWSVGTKVDPGTLKAQFEIWKTASYDVDPKRFDARAAFSSSSLSALAPRMKVLEDLIGNVRLYDNGNVSANTTRWTPGAKGAPLRLLAEMYPPDDGGNDRAPPGQRRLDRYQIDLVPWSSLPKELLQVPSGMGLQQIFVETALLTYQPGLAQTLKDKQQFVETLRGKVREIGDTKARTEMMQNAEQQFRPSFREDAGPSLRQLVARGSYQEAMSALVALDDWLRTLRGRPEAAGAAAAALAWTAKVGPVYADFLRAQRGHDPHAMMNAQAAMEAIIRESVPAKNYVGWLAAGHALADVTYLTALVKHDQAEARWRKDPNSETTKSAARTAQQCWEQFAGEYPDSPALGHALRMRARAQVLAGAFKQAAESYKKAADKLSGLEKAACLVLAADLATR